MYILTQNKDVLIKDYVALYYESIPEHCILCSVSRENQIGDYSILLGKYDSQEHCREIIKNISIAIARGVKCYEMPSS